MTFREKLNQELTKKQWSVYQLSSETKIPYTTLKSHFLSENPTIPSYGNAILICNALGVPADFFADCEDVMTSAKKGKKKKPTDKKTGPEGTS